MGVASTTARADVRAKSDMNVLVNVLQKLQSIRGLESGAVKGTGLEAGAIKAHANAAVNALTKLTSVTGVSSGAVQAALDAFTGLESIVGLEDGAIVGLESGAIKSALNVLNNLKSAKAVGFQKGAVKFGVLDNLRTIELSAMPVLVLIVVQLLAGVMTSMAWCTLLSVASVLVAACFVITKWDTNSQKLRDYQNAVEFEQNRMEMKMSFDESLFQMKKKHDSELLACKMELKKINAKNKKLTSEKSNLEKLMNNIIARAEEEVRLINEEVEQLRRLCVTRPPPDGFHHEPNTG
mmetsp:Transcript_16365/g.31993  ORF Transcript_16365/g.31993 Transcript_16365/m.31993 type:complete len:294 (-) Transcript_16365:12-893(-)